MRVLGRIVKSVMTFVALAVLVVLLSAALPDSREATQFVGALAIVSALGWIMLTLWWLLRLRPTDASPRGSPGPFRSEELPWVIKKYQKRTTLRELARVSDCSSSTIRRGLLNAGITLRSPGKGKHETARAARSRT